MITCPGWEFKGGKDQSGSGRLAAKIVRASKAAFNWQWGPGGRLQGVQGDSRWGNGVVGTLPGAQEGEI